MRRSPRTAADAAGPDGDGTTCGEEKGAIHHFEGCGNDKCPVFLSRGTRRVAEAVEWFVAVTALVVGTSHALRPRDWADAFRQLHGLGRPGAFVNGGLTLAA